MKDAGYDVADYRDIEPVFGTLAEADALIAEAHAAGIKVIIDIVPNHTSDQHLLFQRGPRRRPGLAANASASSSARAAGPTATCPPTTGEQVRRSGLDPGPGGRPPASGTCTCSPPSSPTSTGDNADIKAEFEQTLRFWFDRGVDGFRIDVAHGLVKDAALPDLNGLAFPLGGERRGVEHPHWDQPGVHDIFREWRRSPTSTPRPARRSAARSGSAVRIGWPPTCVRTSCTPPSTSTS